MFGHLNPIVTLLHNTKLNRWHPSLYLESPLPGPPEADKPVRHKSKMHHTNGFDTREAALASAVELIGRAGGTKLALGADLEWDGEDIPADVAFFVQDGADKNVYKIVL